MEVVEDASRALVKSCNELLDFLARPQDEVQFRNAMVKASDALFKAKRFSYVLGTCRGHARFRRSNKPETETSIPRSILLDSLFLETDNHTSFQDSPTKSILNSSSSHENHTRNLLESSSLNHSSVSLLQPTNFHQNLNAELVLSSKNSLRLEFGSKGKAQPNTSHQNLNAEPGSSSKSSVCLDLSSNGKSNPSLFHRKMNAEAGLSSKSSVFLDLSSNGRPPIHRSHQAPTPFQFHQHLQQQKLQHQQYEQQQMKHHAEKLFHSRANLNIDSSCYDPIMSSSRSFMSSLSMDGSVINLSRSSFHYMAGPHSVDQNSQHLKRKCPGNGGNGSVHCGSNGPSGSRCHCAKKRKNKFRKSIIVPAISNKMADIPPDEYSWRKYGQKPIKNADHPRGYYKCSGNKGCPAKKRVERCTDEPTQLRITYENDHNHPVGQGLPHTHSA